MEKIRKGDDVIVITGKDKGQARYRAAPRRCEKHSWSRRQSRQEARQAEPHEGVAGGIVDKDMPIHVSNVAVFNPASRG